MMPAMTQLRTSRFLSRPESEGRTRDGVADRDPLMRLSILMKIGQALSGNLEFAPLLETVHREVGRLFDTTNFLIALYSTGAPDVLVAMHFEHGERQPVIRRSMGKGFTSHVLLTGSPVLIASASEWKATIERLGIQPEGQSSKSWMGVPLITGEQVVGAMAIQSYEIEGAYGLEDLELFSAIASQIAVAVRNAQLYEDAQRHAREMEALAAASRDLTSSLNLDEVLGRIAANVRRMLTHDSVAIFLKRENEDEFKAFAASGVIEEGLQALTVRKGVGILGDIVQKERSEIVNNATGDPRAIHIPGTPTSLPGEKLMAVPLFSRQRVIGLMGVWRAPEEPPFLERDLGFLEDIGRHASVGIQNAQLFEQAKASMEEAESANRAKSLFLASMSHELRTPLNAILLYCELLLEEAEEREMGSMGSDLAKIQGAGKHLLGLIDDILDLSRIEAGRMLVHLEDCNLPDLISDIAATLEPVIVRNNNRFDQEIEPHVGILETDHQKLRQILLNLLGNAAKFTQNGTIRLRVWPEGGQVCFEVSDTGIGMNPEQMEHIFHEFSQAEASTSRRYGGAGLGLTLCRKFASLLGGDIEVSSRLGEGSTFTVKIPV
jgi:signal transduction histidine kinase